MATKRFSKVIIYPEISYKLMGVLFKVHSKLGNTYQEKYYQRSIESELVDLKIPFSREVEIKLNYDTKLIGKYFLDFVIDDKIVLEVKTVPFITRKYEMQLVQYLKTSRLKLGIVANFRPAKLAYKRIVNPEFDKTHP